MNERAPWIPKSLVSDEDHYRPEYVLVWLSVMLLVIIPIGMAYVIK